jgi:hypothetical protein
MQSMYENWHNRPSPSMLASLSIGPDVLTPDILALSLITLVLV